MNKEELNKAAEPVFEFHKDAEFLYATGDGQFFLPKAKNHAYNHAKMVGREVVKLHRDGKEPVESKKGKAENDEPTIESYNVKQLKEVAALNNIEITAKKKAGILAEVKAGLEKLHALDAKAKQAEGSEEEE